MRIRKKRLRKFEEQFPESLEFVARSMRAGHAFSVSLEMIHREFQDPLAVQRQRGVGFHAAMLARRAAPPPSGNPVRKVPYLASSACSVSSASLMPSSGIGPVPIKPFSDWK